MADMFLKILFAIKYIFVLVRWSDSYSTKDMYKNIFIWRLSNHIFLFFLFLNSLIFEHIFCVWFQTASLLYDVFVLVNLLLFYEHYELNRLSINESVSILETFRRIFPDGEPKNLTSYLQVLEQTGKTGINLRYH